MQDDCDCGVCSICCGPVRQHQDDIKRQRIQAAKEEVVEAAKEWVGLFRKHMNHEVPMLPHNKALWEAVRELEEVSRG